MTSNLEDTLDYTIYDSLWSEYRTQCSVCKREILASKWEMLKVKVQYHLVSMDCTASVTD